MSIGESNFLLECDAETRARCRSNLWRSRLKMISVGRAELLFCIDISAYCLRHDLLSWSNCQSRSRRCWLDEVKRPFHKPGWVYEEKYDGYRMLAFKDGARVQLISRNLKDFTRQFAGVARAIAALKAKTLILDGEIAVFDERLVSHLGY